MKEKKLNISKSSNDSWKRESVEIKELENIFEGKTIEPAPEKLVDDETTQLLSNTHFADVTSSNKMDDTNETLHKHINCEEVKNMKNYVEEQENIDKLESSSQGSSDKCSMIEGSEVGSETLEDARNNAERIERVLESTTNEVCTIASVKNSIICYSNTSKEQKNSKEKIESIAQSDHTQQRNSTNDFDLNRKHNNNSEKKKSEDIMKGDLSHDIINKVFTSLKISCRDYRNKISILGELHEQVTFLINDEFGRYIYAQIDKSTYNQIINDPTTLTTIDMNMINGCYLKDASLDLSVKTNVMKLIHNNYFQDATSILNKKDRNEYDSNENPFDKMILAGLNDIEKVWQNCFVFNEEGSDMYRIEKIMQGKYHTISECRSYNDLSPDIKLAIVEHIKECSTEQQQLLSHDNRKNHKLLDAPTKRKKYNDTEESSVVLQMKELSQQPESSKIELTKLKSNTNEGRSRSSKELQLYTSFNHDLHQRDKDNVKNTHIDCLKKGESTSAIKCLDHETGKEKDLPSKIENSKRINGNTKILIGSTFSDNTCSPSEPRSRLTPLPCFRPISPTPSLPYLLILKSNDAYTKSIAPSISNATLANEEHNIDEESIAKHDLLITNPSSKNKSSVDKDGPKDRRKSNENNNNKYNNAPLVRLADPVDKNREMRHDKAYLKYLVDASTKSIVPSISNAILAHDPKSPSHSRSPVLSPHHHPLHITPPNDFKEIQGNSKLRIRHYHPYSSPLIQPYISQSEPILGNDVDESTKKKETRKDIDYINITTAPASKQIFESPSTTQNINHLQSRRKHSVDFKNQSNNRSQSVDNNLSNVYSRNPRTPATTKKYYQSLILLTRVSNNGTIFHLKSSTV